MTYEKNSTLSIALPVPLRQYFNYLPPDKYPFETLQPGIRVRVPFGKRELIGILMEISSNCTVEFHKLKKVTEFLDTTPVISAEILKLCVWAAEYYHHPI